MKKPLFLFVLIFSCVVNYGQSLKKYPIGESGCSLYMYCDPGKFGVSFSEDSSKIYTAECSNEEVGYGLICVKLLEAVNDSARSEQLLIAYLDYLKTAFKINSSVGYGKGHTLRRNPSVHGVLDYWEDQDKNKWKIMGWTDGAFINVLYAYSKKELPYTKVNVFLEGIVFPAK